jgi:heat shock protein HslJ
MVRLLALAIAAVGMSILVIALIHDDEMSTPETIFWSKDDHALLEVRGESYPEYVWTDEQELVLRATGNEPGWLLELGQRKLTLSTNYGQDQLAVPVPRAETADGLTRYSIEDVSLNITILDRYCSDSMTGMPYPMTVIVEHEGTELAGCGGDSASLLLGVEWIVDEIDGAELVEDTQATIEFNEQGRVSGYTSCNRYLGRYALTGEGLTFDRASMGVTRMACLPDVMTQELYFLDIIGQVYRFEIDPDGRLVLHAADGRTLIAHRAIE